MVRHRIYMPFLTSHLILSIIIISEAFDQTLVIWQILMHLVCKTQDIFKGTCIFSFFCELLKYSIKQSHRI